MLYARPYVLSGFMSIKKACTGPQSAYIPKYELEQAFAPPLDSRYPLHASFKWQLSPWYVLSQTQNPFWHLPCLPQSRSRQSSCLQDMLVNQQVSCQLVRVPVTSSLFDLQTQSLSSFSIRATIAPCRCWAMLLLILSSDVDLTAWCR
jgi:hypothetical protein